MATQPAFRYTDGKLKPRLFLLVSIARVVIAQSSAPSVAHVLDVVRQQVERLETTVPDFICDEQIVSRFYKGTKVKKEARAQSVLTTKHEVAGADMFSETRADMRINGKPSKRDQFKGPFVWKGGPAYADLHYLFNSPHAADCRSYRLTAGVKLGDRDTIQLDIRTNPGNGGACRDIPPKSADKVWLDPESLHILRIESVNPPTTSDSDSLEDASLSLIVEYAPVTFDGAEYWLPNHFISRIDSASSPQHWEYESFFSNYHKYGAQSVFHVDLDQ